MTNQHPLQTAKIVTLTPPVYHFLKADSMAQSYELLTNIYNLRETTFLKRGLHTGCETKLTEAKISELQPTLPAVLS